jgi:acyl carrier protein
MTDLDALVRTVVTEIAPDVDAAMLTASTRLQDDLELDSMDILNVMAALSERTGVDIPEADYQQLATVGGAAEYLTTRAAIT